MQEENNVSPETPAIPVAIDDAKFQVEVAFKPEATDEEKNSITPFVQDLIKDIEEAEGTEFAIPAHVNALTIRRIN